MKHSNIEQILIQSQSLNKNMNSLVYLPKEYDGSSQFPVLYFLHGRNGNENILYDIALDNVADRMIQEGKINPLIIVCPCIDNSRGMNSQSVYKEIPDPCDSKRKIHLGRYEDYLINELIKTIDSTFCTINNRSCRYIGGASGGGYAALHNAFRHKNLFSKVGGHMPAIEIALEEEDKLFFSSLSLWNNYDPISIAKNQDLIDIDVYLDCGDHDEGRFYRGCSILHTILQEKGVNSQYYLNQGHHSIDYIKANLENYLLFYNRFLPTL